MVWTNWQLLWINFDELLLLSLKFLSLCEFWCCVKSGRSKPNYAVGVTASPSLLTVLNYRQPKPKPNSTSYIEETEYMLLVHSKDLTFVQMHQPLPNKWKFAQLASLSKERVDLCLKGLMQDIQYFPSGFLMSFHSEKWCDLTLHLDPIARGNSVLGKRKVIRIEALFHFSIVSHHLEPRAPNLRTNKAKMLKYREKL